MYPNRMLLPVLAVSVMAVLPAYGAYDAVSDSVSFAEAEKRFATVSVEGGEACMIKNAHFLNSLAGKVPGVTVNPSSAGAGGAVRVVMRGSVPIDGHGVLYVIDGVPMPNFINEDADGVSGAGTEAAADINPEDINEISFIPGPSAVILYGQDARYGAIVIETRKGEGNGLEVSFSNNTMFSMPMMLPDLQISDPLSFFKTGSNVFNTLSLSAGNEKSRTYLSAGTVNTSGILPGNRYDRYNFNVRNTSSFLDGRLRLDVGAAYVYQKDRNMISDGIYGNPLVPVYLFPIGEDFGSLQEYERYDETAGRPVQWWPYSGLPAGSQNPYWIMERMNRENGRHRYRVNTSLKFQATDWLDLEMAAGIDNFVNTYTERDYAGSILLSSISENGYYRETSVRSHQEYVRLTAGFHKDFGQFSFSALAGGSWKNNSSSLDDNGGSLSEANVFDLANLVGDGDLVDVSDRFRIMESSVLADFNLGWRSLIYVDLAVRNDWRSFPLLRQSMSAFSLSAGVSAVVSNVLEMPSWMSRLNLRASFSNVLDISSVEAGADLGFADGKVNVGVTYYRSRGKDLALDGYLNSAVSSDIDFGCVLNQGLEASLAYDDSWGDFSWSSRLALSYNRNRFVAGKGIFNGVTGEYMGIDFLQTAKLSPDGPSVCIADGGSIGDIYADRDFRRNPDGTVALVDGMPVIETVQPVKVGSILPDVNAGWQNMFSWKGFSLGVMISARFGGQAVSPAQAWMDYYGVSQYSADLRDAGGMRIGGVTVPAEGYLKTVAANGGQGAAYVYDADNIRLKELSVHYKIDRKWLGDVCDLVVGVVADNVCMIWCKAPFDPETVPYASDIFYSGVDCFMQPSLRSVGFNVKVVF